MNLHIAALYDFLKKSGYNEAASVISLADRWYHNTSLDLAKLILLRGLGQHSSEIYFRGKTNPLVRNEFTIPWYGTLPVFLTKDPNLFKGPNDITLSVDVNSTQLVADISTLIDMGAQVTDHRTIWWEEGKEPRLLAPFLDNGEISIDDLITPGHAAVRAAINTTKTGAFIGVISPENISQHIRNEDEEIRTYYYVNEEKMSSGSIAVPNSDYANLTDNKSVLLFLDLGTAKKYAQKKRSSLKEGEIFVYEVFSMGKTIPIERSNLVLADYATIIEEI